MDPYMQTARYLSLYLGSRSISSITYRVTTDIVKAHTKKEDTLQMYPNPHGR